MHTKQSLFGPQKVSPHILRTFKQLSETSADPLAAFVYDLPALQQHVTDVMSHLPRGVELYYAMKANSEAKILQAISPLVDGIEVSSGGEVEKIAEHSLDKPFVFSGPGKLVSDLEKALQQKVEFIHLESLWEIKQLDRVARQLDTVQRVLIRINPVLPQDTATHLSMAGKATPFGIPEDQLDEAIKSVDNCKNLRLAGFHVHGMSHQVETDRHKKLIDFYLDKWPLWQAKAANPDQLTHLNVGGGIGVKYTKAQQFDWSSFCRHLANSLEQRINNPIIRFEPGRFITAYCGFYGIEILDIKSCYGENFAICRGGTHHFRLPAAQNHNHPAYHVPMPLDIPTDDIEEGGYQDEDKPAHSGLFNIVGQLCTPKDVLSRDIPLSNIRIGDLLILPMAGAYGYNISHTNFLCHPQPIQHFIPLTNDLTPA